MMKPLQLTSEHKSNEQIVLDIANANNSQEEAASSEIQLPNLKEALEAAKSCLT